MANETTRSTKLCKREEDNNRLNRLPTRNNVSFVCSFFFVSFFYFFCVVFFFVLLHMVRAAISADEYSAMPLTRARIRAHVGGRARSREPKTPK